MSNDRLLAQLALAQDHARVGDYVSAEQLLRKVIGKARANTDAWLLLGQVKGAQQLHHDAEQAFSQAAKLNPRLVNAHSNLGIARMQQGKLEEAVAAFRDALKLSPRLLKALANTVSILHTLNRSHEAMPYLAEWLAAEPQSQDAHYNAAVLYQTLHQLADARLHYEKVLALDTHGVYAYSTHLNLGVVYYALRDFDAAIAHAEQALTLKPDCAVSHYNLGNAVKEQGNNEEAIARFNKALALKPDFVDAYSGMLFSRIQIECDDAATLSAEHRRFGEQFETPLRSDWPQHANSRDPDRCLLIGVVSGDLRNHAVAHFIEPVLAHLANDPQLSLHAYSNHPFEDAVSRRLMEHFAHWHRIVGMPDEVLAQQIRADGIDILIDLSGHTAHNRLLTFARKPAPLQASWLGYPGSTGLGAMDYYLADRFFLPPGQFESQFTEQIARLPANAPFRPVEDAPAVNALPALSNGYVTFGSFNRLSKLNPVVIALWSSLLRALPTSKMLLVGGAQDGTNEMLIDLFAQEGIAGERLMFHPRCDIHEYLGLHHRVDICLDTFPYNGGTTTCHGLWMGVPTLTLAGRTVPGRQGAAILGHVGLEECVALDAEDFVQKGLFLAGNTSGLSSLRAGLRERFDSSAMRQPAIIAAGLSGVLRTMWKRWCAGLPTEPI